MVFKSKIVFNNSDIVSEFDLHILKWRASSDHDNFLQNRIVLAVHGEGVHNKVYEFNSQLYYKLSYMLMTTYVCKICSMAQNPPES